jgi:hypothetical protein
MKNLTTEEKQYLEQILSNKFHDKLSRVPEMKMIVSILGKVDIDNNQMQIDLNEYELGHIHK